MTRRLSAPHLDAELRRGHKERGRKVCLSGIILLRGVFLLEK
jgi:hypothetical protein